MQLSYDSIEDIYLNLLYTYNQLLDGGDKNALLNQIESTWSQDAWILRATLLEKSPYLSTDALTAAAQKDVLPPAMLFEICLLNPDAIKSMEFMNYLQYEIPNPLPQYMIDLLIDSWETETPRTILLGSLASCSQQMEFDNNLLLTDIDDTEDQTDSVVNVDYTDSIRVLLSRKQNLLSRYELAESYFNPGYNDIIMSILDSIPIDFNLTERDSLEFERYKSYIIFRIGIENDGRSLSQLTGSEVETLKLFADQDDDLPGVMVQNMLCFLYNNCWERIPELPVDNENQRRGKLKSTKVESELNKVEVMPNPATTYTTFSYTLPQLKGNGILTITDMTGRVIDQFATTDKKGQMIWDTRKITNGIYFYQMKDNNSILIKGKVVVEK